MALGTAMKSLVDDILASREDRTDALEDIRKDTHHILGDARSMMKGFAKESEERAQEVKKMGRETKAFLKSAEENRKQDFEATMKTVHSSLADVKKDSKHAQQAGRNIVKDAKALLANIAKDNQEQAKELQEKLKKGEHDRKADFKGMMTDIQGDLKDIRHDVSKVRGDAKDMVSHYHHSRMDAQKHWASLSGSKKKSEGHKKERKAKKSEE